MARPSPAAIKKKKHCANWGTFRPNSHHGRLLLPPMTVAASLLRPPLPSFAHLRRTMSATPSRHDQTSTTAGVTHHDRRRLHPGGRTPSQCLEGAVELQFDAISTKGVFGKRHRGVARDTLNELSNLFEAAYRHIDCASVYGNEKEVGDALKRLFDEGVVRREELFITSKLWCSDHDPEDVPKALKKTLEDLQLDYVDLYLDEKASVGLKPENILRLGIPGTWKAMEKLYDSGKAKAIGVSNFSTKKLGDLIKITRVTLAFRLNAFLVGSMLSLENSGNPKEFT